MQKCFITLYLLLIVNIGIAQKQKEGWKYNHLKGKVKTMETTHYDKDDKIERIEKQYFDSTGTLLSVVSETIMGESRYTTIEKYEYDGKGNLVYKSSTDDDQEGTNWIYSYDDKGNRIITEAGELRWEDTYDAKGHLVQSLYLKNGRLDEKITITDNANTSEEKRFNAKGEHESTEFAKFNAQKNYTERSKFDADGKLITKWTYSYNKSNDVISFVTTNKTGSDIRTYTYLYDSMKNWISKTQIKDGVKQSTEKRDIEYY